MIKLDNVKIYGRDGLKLWIKKIELEAARSYLIIGKSSSGKSILLKTVLKLYNNYKGLVQYSINGRVCNELKTSFINTQYTLEPDDTVIESIRLTLRGRVSTAKIQNLLDFLKLDLNLNTKIRLLSYTERKCIELVRIVLNSPQLMVIDDFEKVFDEMVQIKVLALLDRLRDKGTTVLVCSRNLIKDFDAVIYLKNGELCLN